MPLNQAGSLVLTGVPAGLIAAFLRYTGAGKIHLIKPAIQADSRRFV